MKIVMTLFLSCFFLSVVYGQGTVIQPKIMVIPYTTEEEDIRTILETDVNKRIAVTKIKEAFDSRGFTTVDFIAKLKAVESAQVFNSGNRSDIKAQIIEMSGADIYVEAEINYTPSSSGNDVKLIITAYECSTGNSLANKIGESGKFYTSDVAKLATKAINACADEFLSILQSKFTDMIENGKSIVLQIGFDESSIYTMESEVGSQGLLLSDEIELWIEEHAFNNNYHLQGLTSTMMIFDDVRLPLIDSKTQKNYTLNRFGIEMFKFFNSLGIKVSRSVKSNTLYITIK